MKIEVGQGAPGFSLLDQGGRVCNLSDFKGQWVLVYFYPKDDTPGCTVEACSLRDNLPEFEGMDVVVLGVSPDGVKSHKRFAEKFGLSFLLLADEDKKVVEEYGVWQEKSMYGKKYMGVLRTSFLIDPRGVVVKVYEKVKPEVHADEVLSDMAALNK